MQERRTQRRIPFVPSGDLQSGSQGLVLPASQTTTQGAAPPHDNGHVRTSLLSMHPARSLPVSQQGGGGEGKAAGVSRRSPARGDEEEASRGDATAFLRSDPALLAYCSAV